MANKKKLETFIGKSTCGKPIVNGKLVFKLVDSDGIPFTVIDDIIRENNWGFDIVDFIKAIKHSKNYSMQSCVSMLTGHLERNTRLYSMTINAITHVYSKK
ncbi:hypothetical protein CMI47_13185 [Candidatus Pacearchaeota archaeon]|nr:hypothetical protein [Candidatus Pacearchaeota archaeon]|tara:strand:- start:1043 stop:1345 length:303 start_codon:yes stop_codon:yes gene_type:complete